MSTPPTSSPEALIRHFAELISLAVHELRTPASVVGGYLRMLQRDTDPPMSERQQKMVGDAEKAFGRMVALVNELSDLGKLDDGRTTLQKAPVDVFAVIEDVAGKSTEAADRGVRLVVRGPESGAVVFGDPARLNYLFASLVRAVLREQLANAVVVVDRRVIDGQAHVVISPEADADTVSSRTAADFDDKRGGMGLALPIARRVVEIHGGRIWSPAAESGEASSRAAILVSLPLQNP